jgi:DDE superfamily endonuclease
MRYEFLPPYSPDYNPIELCFSAMKYYLRRNGDYVLVAMSELSETEVLYALHEAVYRVGTLDNAFGWFRHCGYI